jgi:hypothetical protein
MAALVSWPASDDVLAWPRPARAHGADAAPAERIAASATLKSHMTAIRDAVADVHSLVTHRRLPKQMAVSFAEKVARSVAAIRAEPSHEAAARQVFEPLLVQISSGAEAVAGRNPAVGPIDGIVAIDEALAIYPKRFDHPGWKGAREL